MGTVIRWDADRGAGVIGSPDLPGDCSVDAGALHPSAHGRLRAGQVVEVEWMEAAGGSYPFRAARVTPRDELQATPGG